MCSWLRLEGILIDGSRPTFDIRWVCTEGMLVLQFDSFDPFDRLVALRSRLPKELRIFSRRRLLFLSMAATSFPVGCLAKQPLILATLEQFGGGVTVVDNTAALVRALDHLAQSGGGCVSFGTGRYRFASASLAHRPGIELPANITLAGRGKDQTELVVTGDEQCYFLLNERGASNHLVRDLTARGNGVAHGNGPGGFYYCSVLRSTAVADVVNCRFANVRLRNFGGDFWIRFYCTSDAHSIHLCGIEPGCEIISAPGNARGPENLGITTFAVEFRGDGGLIADCFVHGLKANLRWLKGGVAAFGRVRNLSISDVALDDAFAGYAVPDKGAYAILLYDTGPNDIVTGTMIERPAIMRPFSCGLYLAGTRDTKMISPMISGQSDIADATLPKGAISLNGANRVSIHDPILRDNAYDLQITGISGPEYDSRMGIVVNGGSGSGARVAGIKIRPSPYAFQCGGIEFDGYRSVTERPGASGMVWQMHPNFHGSGKSSGITDVVWNKGECSGGPGGFDVDLNVSSNSENPSGRLVISDLILGGRDVLGSFVAVGCKGGEIRLTNVKFVGTAHRHIDVRDCARLVLSHVEFTGKAADGVHMFVSGTPHSIEATNSTTADRLARFST